MSDEKYIETLAKLSDLDYERTRKNAALELDISLVVLDKIVKKERRKISESSELFEEIRPFEDSVDTSELHVSITELVKKYVLVPDYAAESIAYWVMLTYVYDEFRVLPTLSITSATKRCGKTTLLILLSKLVNRPLLASNITAACIFRAVDKFRPTLLIDEADTFLYGNDELRGILNCGHTKDAAFTMRVEGDNHVPKRFSTWCPKAIACIGKLPNTLNDRSIVVRLERKHSHEKLIRLSISDNFTQIQSKCMRWAQDNVEALGQVDITFLNTVNDRAADNWSSLIAIAELANNKELAIKCAEVLSLSEQSQDEDYLVLLLQDLYELFQNKEKLPSKEIVEELNRMEDRPWPEIGRGKGMTTTRLAKMLKELSIKPCAGVFESYSDGTRGYRRLDFVDAFTRYLNGQGASTQVKDGKFRVPHEAEVSDLHPCDLLQSCNRQDLEIISKLYSVTSSHVLERMGGNQLTRFDEGQMSRDELEDIISATSERFAIQND